MLDAGLEALLTLFTLERLMWLGVGILLGTLVGLLPGMGGVTGMALLLPFIYGMEPSSGIALMIGLMAVTSTSDTFPAVLIGVPGSGSSQASIMEGYPLARQGLAGRALGAAFIASMCGGLVGALAIFATLPAIRELVLAMGSPQLFMLTLFGVTCVGVLARGSPVGGLLAAFAGFTISAVGAAPSTGEYRYSFGSLYLTDGVALAILVLGLFAIPEIVDLARAGTPVAGRARMSSGLLDGARETLRHKLLVLRSSVIGVLIGVVPGLGGSAASWIVYSTAIQTSKDKRKFGKGDIRGLIAPEAANNSVDGGSLIPTLLFSIPGGGSAAILLGGLVLLGFEPGPSMASDAGLSTLLLIVWSLALANLVTTALCFVLARAMIRISFMPGRVLAPLLLVICMIAAYQNHRSWGDILLLFGLGVVGWAFKHLGWPRPPLLIGFVLGIPAERYLGITLQRYGWEWLSDPVVIVMGVLSVASIVAAWRFARGEENRAHRRVEEAAREG